MSDPDIHHPPPETHSPPILALRSAAITIPHKIEDDNIESNEDRTGKHMHAFDNNSIIIEIFIK